MPIYEYTCSNCQKTSDVLQKVNDPAPAKCQECGSEGTLTRLVSRTSFVLKGGGWYSDLYSSVKKGSGGEGGGGSSSSGSGGSSSGGTTSGGSSSGGSTSGSGGSSGGGSTAAAAAPRP